MKQPLPMASSWQREALPSHLQDGVACGRGPCKAENVLAVLCVAMEPSITPSEGIFAW